MTTPAPNGEPTHAPATLPYDAFERRHNSAAGAELTQMLEAIGADSLVQLIDETIPADIRLKKPIQLEGLDEGPMTERELLNHMAGLAGQNKVVRSLIGMGYYGTFTPPVIQRNILENPAWYTAYTPYQAEIAQGRMEMLLNYQTLVTELTGMEVANASLLDEATAAAEAMTLLHGARHPKRRSAQGFFVADTTLPQTVALLQTRAQPLGIEVRVAPLETLDLTDTSLFGVLVSYPDAYGTVRDLSGLLGAASQEGVRTVVTSDLLALTLLPPPGQMGADVVVGSAQRLGVPMGYGGPHAAFFATRDELKRLIPGRIIGLSVDAQGNPAMRMALQTREQHIRRERATSNICTAQVLLSVMAASYVVYHGPVGLRELATRVTTLAGRLADGFVGAGFRLRAGAFFDTVFIETGDVKPLMAAALEGGFNLNDHLPGGVGISLDELSTGEEVDRLISLLAPHASKGTGADRPSAAPLPVDQWRPVDYLRHENFHAYGTEHEMLRYLKRLENRDLSLVHSMIPLGSCTMKLNATAEMMPLSMAGFAHLHPFCPADQATGYRAMLERLSSWLCQVTGFAAMSLQPNSGAQGEYAGLLTIRAYLDAQGQGHRNIALIPQSAHGTNPASAVMTGFKVVVVKTDERGNVDLKDLERLADEHRDHLGVLMVTYPSTHGVFESSIRQICRIVHERGGQVYMDGANMNAQVGLTSPAAIGADVCHLNLHKTFCIPHGGGGPGMGPIGVAAHLVPFLSGHPVVGEGPGLAGGPPVSAAPFGSASILTISYAYIAMMGPRGLERATERAILNANYLMVRLRNAYPILYTGEKGRCAHEFILDLRPFKLQGVEAEDVAKRLMDYGYHAPTMSFPVAGTLMIEPTESESRAELDRFAEAMLEIRREIEAVMSGQVSRTDSVLKMAPHTMAVVCADDWQRAYSRQQAAFPLPWVAARKFWPSVGRVDNAYGDRNLICTCTPIEDYEQLGQDQERSVSVSA